MVELPVYRWAPLADRLVAWWARRPIAYTLLLATVTSPKRELANQVAVLRGAATIDHMEPFQCSSSAWPEYSRWEGGFPPTA
jgi:hypothetical protein